MRAYEDRLHATIHARLPPEVRERLDALLQPPPAGTEADGEDDPAAATGARALLNFVRGDPGRAGVASVTRGLERLEAIRAVGLPAEPVRGRAAPRGRAVPPARGRAAALRSAPPARARRA